MKKSRKMLSVLLAGALAVSGSPLLNNTAFAEGNNMILVIDGEKAITAENCLYRGLGMVSGNNSSRLLLDYKAEHPDKYWEILNHTFGSGGIGITLLKLEMGSDINSSSGTEPSTMRSENEKADVTRGAGFQLAADAMTVNPELSLDMLWWSEPAWVTAADDVYAARYKWYKETLDAAYETYGLVFEYVSANRNERAIDAEWTKYLAKCLDAETDCPYDYSAIKIVGGDGSGTWGIADMMIKDEEMLNAVDVVGGHYTDWTTDAVKKLAAEYGKEIWFSEGCPPMSYSQGSCKYDGTGTGLTDINGVLDIANRIIMMFPCGDMTLYEFQPVISAYYDGVTYCQKQLITAETPWSGFYTLDSGFYMSLHFSQFFKKGWTFIDGASFGDGVAGGDGHAIVDATYTYMTASDPETGDYSTLITNTTANEITYNFEVSSLEKASSEVSVWETRGPDSGSYDENYFNKTQTIIPVENSGKYTYSVTVKPYSMVTVSTVPAEDKTYTAPSVEEDAVLSLPYEDDFEYSGYPESYLESRGYAPRYTTDEGGAFEVTSIDGNNVLRQIITPETKAEEWGATPEPTTNFGDDSWFNYSVSADVKFTPGENASENYVGAGMRYNLAASGISGYWIQLYEDGTWKLRRNARLKQEGKLESFNSSAWTNIRIEAVGCDVCAYINGELVAQYDGTSIDKKTGETVCDGMLSAGRAALYSSYNQNCFDNIKIEAAGDENYVVRVDDTDSNVVFGGDWVHTTMSTFKDYNRTVSDGTENATAEITFEGTGFAILGGIKECTVDVEIDGVQTDSAFVLPRVGNRESSYYKFGLENKLHTVKITVLSGTLTLDSVQFSGAKILTTSDFAEEEILPDETTADDPSSPETTGIRQPDDGQPANIILPIGIIAGLVVVATTATVIISKKKKKQ